MAFSFSLTPEQEAVRAEAREFAERVVEPVAAEIDRNDSLPWDVWRAMAQSPYQYTGLAIPAEMGGRPRPVMDVCLIIEELGAKSCVCAALIEGASLAVTPVVRHGNEEQKRRLLPRIIKGEGAACFCLTEPSAGSDAAGIETVALRDGDSYVLNGRKRYASFASAADYALVFAKTDPDKGARGISAFIVEQGTPGFDVAEKVPCMGMRGHQDEEVVFSNCRVPAGNLLGEEGRGFKYGLATLDETRTTLAAGYIGLAREAWEEAVLYAKNRHAFGQPLADFQAISFPVVEIATQIEAARFLTYRAAWLADQGQKHTAETAAAKALAAETMLRAADLAVTVYGGVGCSQRFKVERLYRDAKTWTFAQGTPNILKIIAARQIFSGS